MLFNSFEFFLFLPIVFLLYWFDCKNRKSQNILVVIASYIFYGWWDWRFLILIILTSITSFASGIGMEYYEKNRKKQRLISGINIIFNLLILSIFKYYNFFVDNIDLLCQKIGLHLDWVTLNIILPVGISFYTFQALSYSIDVYRRSIKPTHDIIEFFAYISFFPQLVAGPIERATNLLPQFQKRRTFDYALAVDGCRQMLWGFAKKLIIADNCATIVNDNWHLYPTLSTVSLLLLAVLFTFQIYCDFSGYSDIAIGCGKIFGIRLMRNFNYPYFSRSIPDFWRRWHISLTTWFRDYIYFPLGGSRCSKALTIRNIFIVWGVSGLWHGANWTYVCWGLYHAALLAIYILLGINTKYKYGVAYKRTFPSFVEMAQMLLTFFLAVIGWIIFRAENMEQAVDYLTCMVTNKFVDFSVMPGKTFLIYCLIFILIEWVQREKLHALQLPKIMPFNLRWVRWGLYYATIILLVILTGSNQTFIYFQF